MILPQTLESVLYEAVDRLHSPQGLELEPFVAAHPEHEQELRELLPALVSLGKERLERAIDREAIVAACELFGILKRRFT